MSDDDGDLTHESAEFFEATYLLLVASLSIGCAHVMEKYHFHFIPESGAIILIGSLFGFIGWVTDSVQIEAASSFNTDIFQLIFLPAIIFESGYSLRKKGLFKNWKPILLYAVFGVAISTAIVALAVIFIFTPNGIGNLTQIEALMFGALISATDPVATLAIFSNLFALDENEDDEDAPTLYNLVFGESVLNDAVAIVLFNTFEGFKDDVDVDGPLFGKIIGNFIYVSICSILIGVGFGLLSALITKWSAIRNNSKFDLVVLYLCAYGSYMIASAFELSGLFAIFFCGIVMGHYTWYNLSAFSKLSSPILFKAIANLCEMLVFCFLGMALFGSSEVRDAWSFNFSIAVFAAMTVGRIAQVIPLTALANWGRRDRITPKEQVAIMYAGLRGALAFALALKTESLKLEHSSQIISCTLTIAMFTTLFQGATTRPLLQWLGITGAAASQTVPLLNAESVQSSSMSSMTSATSEKSSTRRWLHNLDVSLFAPLFLLNTQVAGGKTKKQFREFANGLTQLNYQQKLDAHKEELYNLVLKFSAVDQQDAKSKIHAERQKTNDTGARFSL